MNLFCRILSHSLGAHGVEVADDQCLRLQDRLVRNPTVMPSIIGDFVKSRNRHLENDSINGIADSVTPYLNATA